MQNPEFEKAYQELKEMVDVLNKIPKETCRHYFQNKSDVLIDQFNNDFESIPNDDPIKINCLNILMSFGVNPYQDTVIPTKEYKTISTRHDH